MAQVGIHDNVVSLIGVVTSGLPLMLLLSYCEYGELSSVLKKRAGAGARALNSLEQKMFMLIDIARGMEHLGTCSLIHRDLAARNVRCPRKKKASAASFFGGWNFFMADNHFLLCAFFTPRHQLILLPNVIGS